MEKVIAKEDISQELISKKVVCGFVIVMTALVFGLCLFLNWHEMRIKTVDVSNYEKQTDDFEFKVKKANMKIMKTGSANITVTGWCIKCGEPTRNVAMHIIVRSVKEDKYYLLPTFISENTDITEKKDDGINYDNSEFNVKLSNVREFSSDKDEYELFLIYETGSGSYCVSLDKKLKIKREK